jgi:hypothetical protein
MHDKTIQASVENLSWAGTIPSYSCGENCYSDFYAEVEANVGVNKSNYFISRKMDFSVSTQRAKINRKLDITLTNSANQLLAASGQYKVYLRVLVPQDATILSVNALTGQSVEGLTPDIAQIANVKEAGVYVEILPGQVKKIRFEWESEVPANKDVTSYGLYIRKQAGTESDPLRVNVYLGSTNFVSQPRFTLTDRGVYTYNTNLSKDFFARFSLKQPFNGETKNND